MDFLLKLNEQLNETEKEIEKALKDKISKGATCYLYIIDATLFPYAHAIISSMMKIFIVLSLGAQNTNFP